MSLFEPDRRVFMSGAAALAALSFAGIGAAQVAAPFAPQPQPLPFDPKSLGWLSEKLITSHHDNNYAGAVKRIAVIRAELAKLDMASAPGFLLSGLKREELIAWNSMILHELYFAGLNGGGAVSSGLGKAIERDFGSMDKWAGEFSAMGKALGGGSGWVLLTWSPHDNRLVNQWAADHTMTLASSTPILALDMYEHAYQMDFGAAAGRYVDGFMKGMSWANANRLFGKMG